MVLARTVPYTKHIGSASPGMQVVDKYLEDHNYQLQSPLLRSCLHRARLFATLHCPALSSYLFYTFSLARLESVQVLQECTYHVHGTFTWLSNLVVIISRLPASVRLQFPKEAPTTTKVLFNPLTAPDTQSAAAAPFSKANTAAP